MSELTVTITVKLHSRAIIYMNIYYMFCVYNILYQHDILLVHVLYNTCHYMQELLIGLFFINF